MALQRTQHHKFTFLKASEKDDLVLLLHFLQSVASKGVSLTIFRSESQLMCIDLMPPNTALVDTTSYQEMLGAFNCQLIAA
jgi:hypothetical protein